MNIADGRPRAMIPVLLVLSPFVLDTGLAITRRLLSKNDVFTGDRRHVYDLLHEKYLSVKRVDGVMWAMGLAFAGLGFAATYLPLLAQLPVLAVSWLAVILWMVRLGMFRPEAPRAKANGQARIDEAPEGKAIQYPLEKV